MYRIVFVGTLSEQSPWKDKHSMNLLLYQIYLEKGWCCLQSQLMGPFNATWHSFEHILFSLNPSVTYFYCFSDCFHLLASPQDEDFVTNINNQN